MKTYLCLIAITVACPAQAAILTTVGGGYSATGITGLVVGDNVYDVTFSRYNSFDGLFGVGDPPDRLPTFYNDPAGATAAQAAIVAALNSAPIVPIEAGFISPSIVIPYRYELDPENRFRNAGVAHSLDFPSPTPPPWAPHTRYVGDIPERDFIGLVFAEFTLISTPEPASIAAWLGLLAAGAITYRRRRQQ